MARGSLGESATVLVVLPNRLSCQLLADALKRSRYRFRVVAEAVNSDEALAASKQSHPQVVVLSAALQDGPESGFRALQELHARDPKARVIVLLDSPQRQLVLNAFRGGASGVFSDGESVESLCKCIESVHKGQIWASSRELQLLLDALAEAAPLRRVDGKGLTLLTEREEQVVHLVAEGLSNREISRKLGLSEHTVKNYLFHVYEKLGISSRAELILHALKQENSAAGD